MNCLGTESSSFILDEPTRHSRGGADLSMLRWGKLVSHITALLGPSNRYGCLNPIGRSCDRHGAPVHQ